MDSPLLLKNHQQLLSKFEDVFQVPKELPPHRLHDHIIPLVDEAKVKAEIERLIGEMLQASIIKYSTSPFASPLVMVKKKDGNYKKLNQLTIKDQFPIPIIEELLDELGATTHFSKLDLRSCYHQIRMWDQDIHKTTFKTYEGIMNSSSYPLS
ncbi:reverse transcriptase [Gossypium australe]|uniref:Reverse transcriptase n=1 Tax=Gossypium australe TaxID=47621 RepID=A0A5B6UU31_9ROSI|nr:reverse transcriptase [Gossypium australe]